MNPLVTIGVPTFRRPELLTRTLECIARQEYPNIEVLIADNAPEPNEAERVAASFRGRLSNLRYHRHEENIGAIANFFYLLREARGEYFMWLADDDEISPDYVATLAGLLTTNLDASTAAGHWMLMRNEREGTLMPTAAFPQTSRLARAVSFIWRSDDAFFYALHRTAYLRQASFRGYWWPNRRVLLNWAYVFLLDMVLRGRVLLAEKPSVQFINHDYTAKTYIAPRQPVADAFARVVRRLNVHWLYWEKCAKFLNPLFLPVLVLTSLATFAREGSRALARRVGLLPANVTP